MFTRIAIIVNVFIFLALIHGKVFADSFLQGNKSANVTLGSGNCFDDNCVIIGGGVGYFFFDGFQLSLDARAWLGGDRDLYEVSPGLTYFVTQLDWVIPYFGVLYQKTFVEDLDDLSAFGGRAGLVINAQGGTYTRLGLVYLEYQDCGILHSDACSETYPEISIGFNF